MSDAPQLSDLVFIGFGRSATGTGEGWARRSDLFARCHRCGDLIDMWTETDEQCRCGGLYKDAGAGRFGHRDGDQSVAIYRRT